jgi:hypothetical protein
MAEAVNGVFEDTTGGIVAVSSIFITAAKDTELSNAFSDLLRQAGEKDPEWQATKELRKTSSKPKRLLRAKLPRQRRGIRGYQFPEASRRPAASRMPAIAIMIKDSQKPEEATASRMPEIAIEDRR